METTSNLGKNRTGIQSSPKDTQELIASSLIEAKPATPGDESELALFRQSFMREADLIGSVPPPGTVKGVLKSGLKMATGNRPQTLVDKIAERLAFERTGTRLYEALITKHQLKAEELKAVPVDELKGIHADEVRHFALLVEALESLGADPTAQTPCADVVGVESLGLLQVITDARTTFAQSLHAILVAELADNDGWEMLVELAELEKNTDLAERFREALEAEERHLDLVRTWMRELLRAEASVVAVLTS